MGPSQRLGACRSYGPYTVTPFFGSNKNLFHPNKITHLKILQRRLYLCAISVIIKLHVLILSTYIYTSHANEYFF